MKELTVRDYARLHRAKNTETQNCNFGKKENNFMSSNGSTVFALTPQRPAPDGCIAAVIEVRKANSRPCLQGMRVELTWL